MAVKIRECQTRRGPDRRRKQSGPLRRTRTIEILPGGDDLQQMGSLWVTRFHDVRALPPELAAAAGENDHRRPRAWAGSIMATSADRLDLRASSRRATARPARMRPVDVSLLRPYRWAVSDNRRWKHFEYRPGDIFVCTPPKCGTTWMQTILASLLWPDGDIPGQVMTISPWIATARRTIGAGCASRRVHTVERR